MVEPAVLLDQWVAAAHWTLAAELPEWPRLAANPEAGLWLRAELQRRFGAEMAAVFAHPAASTYLHALLPHLATGAVPPLLAAVGCRPAIARAVTRAEFSQWQTRLGARVHRLVLHPAFTGLGAEGTPPTDLAASGAAELLEFWRHAALPGSGLLAYLLKPFGASGSGALIAQMPAILEALAQVPAAEAQAA